MEIQKKPIYHNQPPINKNQREPEYPLEIERVANNLEENTLPAKEKKAKSK